MRYKTTTILMGFSIADGVKEIEAFTTQKHTWRNGHIDKTTTENDHTTYIS